MSTDRHSSLVLSLDDIYCIRKKDLYIHPVDISVGDPRTVS